MTHTTAGLFGPLVPLTVHINVRLSEPFLVYIFAEAVNKKNKLVTSPTQRQFQFANTHHSCRRLVFAAKRNNVVCMYAITMVIYYIVTADSVAYGHLLHDI